MFYNVIHASHYSRASRVNFSDKELFFKFQSLGSPNLGEGDYDAFTPHNPSKTNPFFPACLRDCL
jgi:hypothetical protein